MDRLAGAVRTGAVALTGDEAVRKWHLVTYDVRDDARLRRVARLLEGYGERLQYSVFRCRLGEVELQRLRWELTRLVGDEDDLLFVPICDHCAGGVASLHARQPWDRDTPAFTVV
jgi:CRISPR-associated protein Cas2